MVEYITAEVQLMNGTHGALWLPFHVILATDFLDQANQAVLEVEDGMEVHKGVALVCIFIQYSLPYKI